MIHIIGGGITGLSLAYFLNRSGIDVVIYEASDRLGGNCTWVNLDENNIVDCYYHILTSTDNSLRDMMGVIGVAENLYPIQTTMAFHSRDMVFPVNTMRELISFPPLNLKERFFLGTCFLRSLTYRDWKALDDVSSRKWLTKIGSDGVWHNFWLPIMKQKFGPFAEQVSATDMWFRLNRLLRASLCGGGNGAFYLKGTFKVFFDKMGDYLKGRGVQIHLKRRVKSLIVDDCRISGLEFDDRQKLDVNRTVATVPLPIMASMLPDESQAYKLQLQRIEYLHNLCLIIKTREPITKYYQLAVSDADMPFTGVIGAHQMYPPEEYGGYITYITKYTNNDKDLFKKKDDELLSIYTPYLKKINKDFSKQNVLSLKLIKGRNVEAVHQVGYNRLIPEMSSPIKGLNLLCAAQIYPEPTVLDIATAYARRFTKSIVDSGDI